MALAMAVPQNLGLWHVYPLVQLDALPLIWILALVSGTALGGVMLHSTPTSSASTRTALKVLIILLICAVLVKGTQFLRAGGPLPVGLATVTTETGNLTVLSFNARDTEARDIALAAADTSADAVLLVETNSDVATGVVQRLQRQGVQSQAFMGSGTALQGEQQVAIIVTETLGTYDEVPSPALAFGAVTIAPRTSAAPAPESGESRDPILSAVHPPAPFPGKVLASVWRQQLQAAVAPCRQAAAIVGGDFNASSRQVSHVMGSECLHAGTQLGREAVGTWPTFIPAPLGASIDHQIAHGGYWEPVGIEFMEIGRSDHRAVAVTYRALDS
ncbi:endonuclease/exonuclease/phosphatase family protein [Kocuria rosea]|uniref:endonuclease/exonuclease/phosphatase family protein n=1 Tax=Kocuria rosea TaxID=1275 RepID=UPI0011B1ED88|nr:endonuclease/exonuclease/phosphatase family protein [Kocuria rosea]